MNYPAQRETLHKIKQTINHTAWNFIKTESYKGTYILHSNPKIVSMCKFYDVYLRRIEFTNLCITKMV